MGEITNASNLYCQSPTSGNTQKEGEEKTTDDKHKKIPQNQISHSELLSTQMIHLTAH